MWNPYFRLMRWDKPIGTLLLLWPTLWALWLASSGLPSLKLLFIFVSGTFLMRSAGCVINDYADRRFDLHVQRTQQRPLTQNEISPQKALILFVALSLLSFILVLFLNTLSLLLSLVAVGLIILYPYTKRFFHAPQLFLGITFGWGILIAFAAVQNQLSYLAWILYLANLCWTIAYDTEYGMADRKDDLTLGLYSTAILFGKYDRLVIALLQLLFLILLVFIGLTLHLKSLYYSGLGVAFGLMLYQQWLIRERHPAHCFKAFLNNQWVGAAIFCGLLGSI